MDTTYVKKLASLSYKNDKLDPSKVNRIGKLLKRDELRKYIKCLKSIEEEKNVTVILPKQINKRDENIILKMYQGKTVKFVYDPSLIAGFKIVDNDSIYEYNLKDTINQIGNFITE